MEKPHSPVLGRDGAARLVITRGKRKVRSVDGNVQRLHIGDGCQAAPRKNCIPRVGNPSVALTRRRMPCGGLASATSPAIAPHLRIAISSPTSDQLGDVHNIIIFSWCTTCAGSDTANRSPRPGSRSSAPDGNRSGAGSSHLAAGRGSPASRCGNAAPRAEWIAPRIRCTSPGISSTWGRVGRRSSPGRCESFLPRGCRGGGPGDGAPAEPPDRAARSGDCSRPPARIDALSQPVVRFGETGVARTNYPFNNGQGVL